LKKQPRTQQRERSAQAAVLRDLVGPLPFRTVALDPAWLTDRVADFARTIYEQGRFEELPILADLLEDCGCTDTDLLDHCRGPGPHFRGCWALDLVAFASGLPAQAKIS
jgi:hypothetical protein